MQEAHSKAQEAKTSGDQALSKASELHAKELDELRAQAEVMKKDLSSSADKSKQLEKQVEELLVYKEQAQVSGLLFWPSSYSVHKVYGLVRNVKNIDPLVQNGMRQKSVKRRLHITTGVILCFDMPVFLKAMLT